jgi:hypothetical protein
VWDIYSSERLVICRHGSEANALQKFRPRLLVYGVIGATNCSWCRIGTAREMMYSSTAPPDSILLFECVGDHALFDTPQEVARPKLFVRINPA